MLRSASVDQFVAEALKLLADDTEETVVEQAEVFRNNAGPAEHAYVNELNTFMTQVLAS